jgi:putative hydrolase of the HAD superfamily
LEYWRNKLSKLSVTFDLWDTLLNDQPGYDKERRDTRCTGMLNTLNSYDLKPSRSKLLEAYDKSGTWLQTAWQTHREISTAEQARRIATEAVVSLPDNLELIRELEDAYVRPVLELPPRLSDEAVETLSGMRDRCLRIGLICNIGRSSGKVLRDLLRDFKILDFFDVTIFSDEVGIRKPDRRIFEVAASGLGVDISTVVHIGDHPEADAWGAKQAGMRAILIELPPELLEGRDLASLWRSTKTIKDSEIRPDARIKSLKEALSFVDQLNG